MGELLLSKNFDSLRQSEFLCIITLLVIDI